MTARVYSSDKKIICTLNNVTIAHIESNAYRISGYTDSHFITTAELSNVIVEIIDQGAVVRSFTQGYATNIKSRHAQGETPTTYVIIEALE